MSDETNTAATVNAAAPANVQAATETPKGDPKPKADPKTKQPPKPKSGPKPKTNAEPKADPKAAEAEKEFTLTGNVMKKGKKRKPGQKVSVTKAEHGDLLAGRCVDQPWAAKETAD